jgi:hypothetical protein
LPIIALLLLALAHAFDYLSFLVMTDRHGLTAEMNPLVVTVAQDFGLPGLTLAKLASVAFLGATAILLLRTNHRRVSIALLTVGIVAGVVGGFSNIAST